MGTYLYTDVADRIESQIENKELTEGQKLPSERKMSELYGVSRNVIREALKILTEKGLIEVRSGKGGYVSKSQSKDVMDKLETAIYKNKSSLLEILEAREVIEMAVVNIVAERASAEDISKLREVYNNMEQQRESRANFATQDERFHVELANCTKNKTLAAMVSTFYSIMDKKLFLVSQLYPQRIMQAQLEHKVMIEAIERHDNAAIVAAMSSHMNCIRNQLLLLEDKQS